MLFRSCNKFSVDEWAVISVFILTFSLLMLSVFLISRSEAIKRIGFFTFAAAIIVFFFIVFLAKHQYNLFEKQTSAIIMSERASVKSSPDEKGKVLFILHSGTKVDIGNTIDDWCEISLPNKNKGWMKKSEMENI